MPTMNTGLVIAGAYAKQVRNVMAAQAKSAGIDVAAAIRGAAILNQKLLDEIIKRKIDKGDVVRIKIDYEVLNGEVQWKYETLNIEIWRKSQ